LVTGIRENLAALGPLVALAILPFTESAGILSGSCGRSFVDLLLKSTVKKADNMFAGHRGFRCGDNSPGRGCNLNRGF
jgi:hypothetical protein